MTIRLRYHLALLPLFLGFAAASVGLDWFAQSREVSRSLAEEAEARAQVLATFLGRSTAPLGATDTREHAALLRFANLTGGLHVRVFTQSSGSWTTTTLLDNSDLTPPPQPEGSLLAGLLAGKADSRHLPHASRAFDETIGYAPVISPDGGVRMITAVSAAETVSRAERRQILHSSIPFIVLVLVSGFTVTEILVRRIRRDIARLELDAGALSANDSTHAWAFSRIRELDDLGATLQSISRILHESVQRTRQRFLRTGQMRGESELAETYLEHCTSGSVQGPGAAALCAVRQIGHSACDHFWGVRQQGATWHAVGGRLESAGYTSTPLQRILRAQAARDYLLGLLASTEPGTAWEQFCSVFPVECGESAQVPQPAGNATVHRHRPNAADIDLTGKTCSAVGTLSPESLDRVRDYVRRFPDRPPSALAAEIAALLGDTDPGVIVVFQTPPPLS